jgi:hypothetical protein
VTARRSVLDVWSQRVAELGEAIDRPDLPVRIIMTHGTPLPSCTGVEENRRGGHARPEVLAQRDAVAFRGTGGVLRDFAQDEPADGYLLVANAAQLVLEPLEPLVTQLAAREADVSFVAHIDGTPSRLMLVRSPCLSALPPVGFVDLMEQGLPLIMAAGHRVTAVHRTRAASLPVRTRDGYIAALQRYHRQLAFEASAEAGVTVGVGEDWRSSFALVEDGAALDSSACLHDSVVLAGGRVGPGAVVARSVVCPGGVVPRGAVVVDQVVGGPGAVPVARPA